MRQSRPLSSQSQAASAVATDWRAYSTLVDALGGRNIGDALLEAVGYIADFDEIFVYRRGPGDVPSPLASAGDAPGAEERAGLYSSGFYRLDPARTVTPERLASGLLARRVQAEDVHDEAYRQACFERPGLAEKVSFAMSGPSHYVLSLYRTRRRPRISDTRYAAVSNFAQMALPLLRRHAELVGDLGPPLSDIERLERQLNGLGAGLTVREAAVCARTLVGRTARDIGEDLGLAATSVLTYRRRAYARLGVSNAGEVLAAMMDSDA